MDSHTCIGYVLLLWVHSTGIHEHVAMVVIERFSRAGPRGRGREWATVGVHPLSWLLSNNRLEKVPFVSVLHTSSNRLLLSNQDKGCTHSVAHSPPLPLGPALLNLWTLKVVMLRLLVLRIMLCLVSVLLQNDFLEGVWPCQLVWPWFYQLLGLGVFCCVLFIRNWKLVRRCLLLLFCFVLFFVLFCFGFCFVLFCFLFLFCFVFVCLLLCFVLFCFHLFVFVFCFVFLRIRSLVLLCITIE